jgi:hypothetical protein
MMEVVGWVLGGLTCIAGLFTTLIRGVDSTLLEARETIKDELTFAYREFGHTVAAEGVESERLDMCVKRLRCLHYVSYRDLLKLQVIDWLLGKPLLLWIPATIVAVISIIVGSFILNETHFIWRGILILVIPLILFIGEVIFLGGLIKSERYLKRVIRRYKNVEYMQ